MSKLDYFFKKLGANYEDGYNTICTDGSYNTAKIENEAMTDSDQKFIQTASETIFYYWLKQKFSKIQIDQKINPANEKDVDIVVEDENHKLNIEIKTPDVDLEKYDGTPPSINIQLDHRYEHAKDGPLTSELMAIRRKVEDDINNSPAKESRVAKCVDLDDNKLLSCIQKAQGKFIKSGDDTINILLIAGDTQRLYHFMDYLTNAYSGLIAPASYIDKSLYEDIDCFVLSNICEAHLDPHFQFNPWDAKNYINFVIKNPFSVKEEKEWHFILELFNDKFVDFICNKDTLYDPIHSGILLLQFAEYIHTKYPQFCLNTKERKY